jgi:hypothetical protein
MRKCVLVSLCFFSANFLFAENNKYYFPLDRGKVIIVEVEKSPLMVFWGSSCSKEVIEFAKVPSSGVCFGVQRMLRYTFLTSKGKPFRDGVLEESVKLIDQNFTPELPISMSLRSQKLDQKGQVCDILSWGFVGKKPSQVIWRNLLQTLYLNGIPIFVNRIHQRFGPNPEDCVIEIEHQSLNAEYSYAR